MKSLLLKIATLFLWGWIIPFSVCAQVHLSHFFEGGENNVSEGFYLKNAYLADFRKGKLSVVTGAQQDIISPSENFLTGATVKIGRDFPVKKFPFKLEGVVLYNPFSDLMHEFNWGLMAIVERQHFNFHLGTNFRTYSLTREAVDFSGSDSNKRVSENRNLMYLAQYNLKPPGNRWNLGITVTNTDWFLINQETNPMFNITGKVDVNQALSWFSEVWYKPAGMMNISVNYFGFFVRTGITWKIGLKKY